MNERGSQLGDEGCRKGLGKPARGGKETPKPPCKVGTRISASVSYKSVRRSLSILFQDN